MEKETITKWRFWKLQVRIILLYLLVWFVLMNALSLFYEIHGIHQYVSVIFGTALVLHFTIFYRIIHMNLKYKAVTGPLVFFGVTTIQFMLLSAISYIGLLFPVLANSC